MDPRLEVRYYSTGGGFILSEEEMLAAAESVGGPRRLDAFPIAFHSMAELLSICEERNVDIATVAWLQGDCSTFDPP